MTSVKNDSSEKYYTLIWRKLYSFVKVISKLKPGPFKTECQDHNNFIKMSQPTYLHSDQ